MADIPVVAHRFTVNFVFNTIPAPLDVAFQRISGLSRELEVSQLREGGENIRNLWLAEKVNHGSLLLERGVTNASILTTQFDRVLRRESTQWANVVIMLLNESGIPLTTWALSHALPVRWQIGDLDASSNTVLINSLELRYQDMSILGDKL
ncbi:phage tail-like protein [Enterobacter sp. BIGb0383]|uniref:phage tail protein n=1 Tax=unclassified Enterobacter TaxID=2608935 RepID=UPI000F465762|nr:MULTISPECIES: phage tail protein [unclassified Enterobacter]ROP62298.1 phage tail-like protein [Enterobacter sp. BIGb0383]ROS12459.1 phage tail-like protein [Enterobacter sp. BIGb0359]